jgi:outer membrane protein OmpA-like peptidoglycan-associated protein
MRTVSRKPEAETVIKPAPKPSPELKEPAAVPKPVSLKITLAAEPLIFTPDGDGIDDTVTFTPIIEGDGSIIRWRLDIREVSGTRPLYTVQGEGQPPESIVWDGTTNNKAQVQSATRYSAELAITAEEDESLAATAVVSAGILVVREGGILRIMVTEIVFPPDSADFGEIDDPKQLQKNKRILDEVAAILKKFSSYSILIEGHANRTVWWDEEAAAKEEREELLPLSLKRAELIARNLEVRGIAGDRITTVGKGSSQPLYPFSDTQNNWKNRRVEFILLSQQEE